MSRTSQFEQRYQTEHEPWSYSDRAAEIVRDEWIVAQVRARGPHRLLDVGCSLGQLTNRLSVLPAEIHAIDVSPTAVTRARDVPATRPEGTRPTSFIAGSATALPYGDCVFDVVVASDGLYSWEITPQDRQRALGEFCRLLRPGGAVLLTEHMRQRRFAEFLAEIHDSPLKIVDVCYLYDRPWYQFESWLKAIQHWALVKAVRRNLPLARFLLRLGRLIGPSASRHICAWAARVIQPADGGADEMIRY